MAEDDKYEVVDKNPDRCPFCGDSDLNTMLTEDYANRSGDKLELTEYQCSNETCRMSFWI